MAETNKATTQSTTGGTAKASTAKATTQTDANKATTQADANKGVTTTATQEAGKAAQTTTTDTATTEAPEPAKTGEDAEVSTTSTEEDTKVPESTTVEGLEVGAKAEYILSRGPHKGEERRATVIAIGKDNHADLEVKFENGDGEVYTNEYSNLTINVPYDEKGEQRHSYRLV